MLPAHYTEPPWKVTCSFVSLLIFIVCYLFFHLWGPFFCLFVLLGKKQPPFKRYPFLIFLPTPSSLWAATLSFCLIPFKLSISKDLISSLFDLALLNMWKHSMPHFSILLQPTVLHIIYWTYSHLTLILVSFITQLKKLSFDSTVLSLPWKAWTIVSYFMIYDILAVNKKNHFWKLFSAT